MYLFEKSLKEQEWRILNPKKSIPSFKMSSELVKNVLNKLSNNNNSKSFDFKEIDARMKEELDDSIPTSSSDSDDNETAKDIKNMQKDIAKLPKVNREGDLPSTLITSNGSNASSSSSSKKIPTLGKGWFDLAPAELTDDLKRDIKMIRMRNFLDPKRFYKAPDKMKKVLHIGTVIEGPSEYLSSRLTKKERKQTFTEEIMNDSKIKSYSKRVYGEIQNQKNDKIKTYKAQKKKKSKPMRGMF